MTYLTFPDFSSGSGILKLRIVLRPGAGSVTVIVVKSCNLYAQSNNLVNKYTNRMGNLPIINHYID